MSVDVESMLLTRGTPGQPPPLIPLSIIAPRNENRLSSDSLPSADLFSRTSAMTVPLPPLTPPASVSPNNGASSNLSVFDNQKSPTTSHVVQPPNEQMMSPNQQQVASAAADVNGLSSPALGAESVMIARTSYPPTTTHLGSGMEAMIAKSRKLGRYSPTRTRAPSLVPPSSRTTVTYSSSVTSTVSVVTTTRTNSTTTSSTANMGTNPSTAKSAKSPTDDENDEDIDSKRGLFGWETIDTKNIPTIFRHKKPHVSVRMVEEKMLKNIPSSFPDKLKNLPPLNSFYITDAERKLLNEINVEHCNFEFGHVPFTSSDVVVKLEDFIRFYEQVKQNSGQKSGQVESPSQMGSQTLAPTAVLPQSKPMDQIFSPDTQGGWLQVNNTVMPYVFRGTARHLPINILRISAGLDISPNLAELATPEEVHCLNRLCKSASVAFEFQMPMKVINQQLIAMFCQSRIAELPTSSPLQYTRYISPEELKQGSSQTSMARTIQQASPQTTSYRPSVHTQSTSVRASNSRPPAMQQRSAARPVVPQQRHPINAPSRTIGGHMRPSAPTQRSQGHGTIVNQTPNPISRLHSSIPNPSPNPRQPTLQQNIMRQYQNPKAPMQPQQQQQQQPQQQQQQQRNNIQAQRIAMQIQTQSQQRQRQPNVNNTNLAMRQLANQQNIQRMNRMNLHQHQRMQMLRDQQMQQKQQPQRFMHPQISRPRAPLQDQNQVPRIGQPAVRYQPPISTNHPQPQGFSSPANRTTQTQSFSSPANRTTQTQRSVVPNTAPRPAVFMQSPEKPQPPRALPLPVQLRSAGGSDIVDLTRERVSTGNSPATGVPQLVLGDNVKYSLKFMPCYGEVVLTLDIEGYGEYCNIDELAKKYFVGLDCAELTYALSRVLRVPLLKCSEQLKYELLHNFDMNVTPHLLGLEMFRKYLPQLRYMFTCTQKVMRAMESQGASSSLVPQGPSVAQVPKFGHKRTLPANTDDPSKKRKNAISDIICLD